MTKYKNTTEDSVRSSVSSIYASLLDKRKLEREEREKEREERKLARQKEKEEEETKEDGTKMTKKEKREKAIENWRETLIGLTGDDLEYSDSKTKKKKYKTWIDDDVPNAIDIVKPKKKKKKNYQKEFEAELSMLKTLVADQNKFTIDLQKRFQNAAGPSTKDAMPLNKTLVDLASAINASRGNSLGLLREIGSTKKTIAELYMKQRKLDADLGGVSTGDTSDLGLMGSNIAASLFGDNIKTSQQFVSSPVITQSQGSNVDISVATGLDGYNPNGYQQVVGAAQNNYESQIQSFDPATWDGDSTLSEDNSVKYENVPHEYVVEWRKNEDRARFKAVRTDTHEELVGCPVPSSDPSKLKFNEKDMTVKGQFDELYKLEIVD